MTNTAYEQFYGQFAPIPRSNFGRDHWSLLAYLVTLFEEPLKHVRLRCNVERHPLLAGGPRPVGWQESWGTRLKDGTRLDQHDDFDCLDDLESAGLVEIVSMVNGIVCLTPTGNELGYLLRQHKQAGGTFATFATFDPVNEVDSQ